MPTDPLAPTDPFSRDDILSMTHQPEAPNPVPGIVKPAIDYLTSGDMMPAHKPGTQPKDYLRELLQHPDIMAKNIEQASNFAGMAGTLKGGAKPPGGTILPLKGPNSLFAVPGVQKYADALIYNKITPQEFEGFMEALNIDKAHIGALRDETIRQRDELRQLVRDALAGMRDEGSLRGPDERAKEAREKFRVVSPEGGGKPPAPRYLITSPEGKSYVLKHSLSEQLQELGGDWHSRPVIDAQGDVIHNPINSQHVSGPILRLNEDGTLTKGILAYHGSPHDFDKFDLSKIGTGEGAQAYGHGLYFAEEEKIAQHYRDALASRREDEFSYRTNKNMPRSDLAMRITRDTGARTPYAATAVLRDLAYGRSFDEIRKGNPASFGPAIDWVERNGVVHEKPAAPEGKMYQVGINADPEHFLDWDRPLSEQSPQVIDALNKAGIKLKHTITDDHIQSLRDQGRNGEADFLEGQRTYIERNSEQTGQNALVNLARQMKEGAQEYDYPSASDALRQAGIPGIKYLDQGSRGIRTPEEARRLLTSARADLAKQPDNQQLQIAVKQLERQAAEPPPTSNYVVFDDKLIDILKKYGWAGLGLPAMGAALPSEKNQ